MIILKKEAAIELLLPFLICEYKKMIATDNIGENS